MRIDTAHALTVSALRALIAGADDNTVVEFFKTPKKQLTGECWCGCGATTKSRFAPGHDSKFHSLAKQVARGVEDMPEFVCDEAEADFMKWHDLEVPKHEARVMAKAVKNAAKAAVKAAKETEVPAPKAERVSASVVERASVVEPVVEPVVEADLADLLAEVTMS